MVDRENIVAIGLLSQKDLDMLGSGFRAAIPLEEAAAFDELLNAIDAAEKRAKARRH